MHQFLSRRFLVIFYIFLLFSCEKVTDKKQGKDTAKTGTITIVTTTGIIGDMLKNLVGDQAKVVSLMGPGVDPHLYKATHGDLKKLQQADLIVYNGLHLEGKLTRVLDKISETKNTFAVGDQIDKNLLLDGSQTGTAYDPHIWFDVKIWINGVEHTLKYLSKLYPEKAAIFKKNAGEYIKQLSDLDRYVGKALSTIPKKQRVLITAHDAFSYYGKSYNIEVKGLQGISTLSGYGIRDVTELVTFIVNRKIKAVFVESSVSDKSIKSVVAGCLARDHEVVIGGTLYSDALGDPQTPMGKYTGMVKYNTDTIVKALK